jgi:hypothetical protein
MQRQTLVPSIVVLTALVAALTTPSLAAVGNKGPGDVEGTVANSSSSGAIDGLPASRNEVEKLRTEVERLRALVDKLLKERGASEPKTGEPLPGAEPRIAEPDITEPQVGAASQPQAAQEPQEKPLPGRGRTEQGLYGSVAAGGQGTRYGRSLFGENVRIGGYGSFRFESNNLDSLPRVNDLPQTQQGNRGFDIRRLVLTTDVNPTERLRFYTELEFERFGKIELERTALPENVGGRNQLAGTRFIQELEGQGGSELKLEQAWAEYSVTKNFAIRGGLILPPLGRFNILHDDDYWDVPRRTLVDRDAPVIPVKSAWSEAGVGFIGSNPIGKGFLNYQLYVVNGVTLDFGLEQTVALRDGRAHLELEPEIGFDSGPVNGSRGANAITWRLGLVPRLGNEIALSGYHGKYTPNFLTQPAYINSFGLDGKLTRGSFEAEGEFIYTDHGKMQRAQADLVRNLVNSEAEDEFNETESEIAVGLKGPFANQRYGYWFDLKYRWRPAWLKKTFLGEGFEDPQLIPILRYERVWFNKFVRGLEFKRGLLEQFDFENLSQDRVTVGFTYRPVSSTPISFAYEHNRRRGGSTLIFPNTLGLGRAPDRSFDALLIGVAFGF